MNIFFIGGMLGNAIQVLAFIPQITHLYKTKDSTGMSLKAYILWLIGDIFLLAYAISILDPIFIMLGSFFTFFTAWGAILILKFKK